MISLEIITVVALFKETHRPYVILIYIWSIVDISLDGHSIMELI